MVSKLISVKQVIAKVMSDLDIKEDSQRMSDYIEWASEAVEKIGSVAQLDRRVSGVDGEPYLEIKGHQAKLPYSLFRLNQVAYSVAPGGPWFPMKVATGTFNAWSSNLDAVDENGVLVKDYELIDAVKLLYSKYVEDPVYTWFSKMDYKTALEILNTNDNARTLLVNLIQRKSSAPSADSLVYRVKPGYINTSAPRGFLKISYDGIHVDEDGYALIPDKMSYIEAVYWYIVMKLTYPEWRSGKVRDSVYADAKRSWNFYCKQAYGDSMMPNQDEMETIKNVWVRLVPDMNADSDFYDALSVRENIYNQTN